MEELSICQSISLSVPGREGWLNHKTVLPVEKAPTQICIIDLTLAFSGNFPEQAAPPPNPPVFCF